MVKLKESVAELLSTAAAVMVGLIFAPEGYVPGGVYSTEVLDAPGESVPHAGEQLVPPAVRVQVAPELDGSFVTVALTVTGAAPIKIEENLLVI